MLAHARPMTWSGRVGFGLARSFVCNFRVESSFLSFGSNISAHTRPVTWSGRVGSGFFRASRIGFIGSGGP